MTDTAPAAQAQLPDAEFLSTHLDLVGRTLYVGDIEEGVADLFIKSMHLLRQADPDAPIHIMINSHGGSLMDALGMYDCIRTAGVLVTCEVFAHCMSAAVLVAQACDNRLLHKSSLVMVHNPSHDNSGDSHSVETWGRYARRSREKIYALLAEHTDKTVAFWRRKCSKGDFLMEAPLAVELGLFDSLIDYD